LGFLLMPALRCMASQVRWLDLARENNGLAASQLLSCCRFSVMLCCARPSSASLGYKLHVSAAASNTTVQKHVQTA
jgi:hypothetical protein